MRNEVRKIRKKFGLTQVQLAEKLGVSQPRIARMEKQKTVTVELIRKIANVLGVSIKELVNNDV